LEELLSTSAFLLKYAECPNKRKKNLPHAEAQIRGGGGQQQVDRIADFAFEAVAAQAGVAFRMPDSWFNRRPTCPAIVLRRSDSSGS
jgi:hypothetical protein